MSRVFTDEELAEFSRKPADKVREAIKTGDLEKISAAFDEFDANFDSTHDQLCVWITEMMSFIYKNMGEQALQDAMRHHVECYMPPMKDWLDPLDFRSRVEAIVFAEQMHNVPLIVTEDDEKVTIQMSECASGLRLVKDGVYGEPHNCARCAADPGTTWGIDDFPCYCVHAPLQDQVAQEIGMKGWYYQEPPAEFGSEACKFHVYKDYEDFPDVYWTRVGRTRPEPGKTIAEEDAR